MGNLGAVVGSAVVVALSLQPLIAMVAGHRALSEDDLKAEATAENVADNVKSADERLGQVAEMADVVATEIDDAPGAPTAARIAEEGVEQLQATIETAQSETEQASNQTAGLRANGKARVQILWEPWNTGPEPLGLWLVVVAGLLGGAVRSLYLGSLKYANSTWRRRFWLWYAGRPILGGALALVVYAGIRGGLLNVGLDSAKLNAYGLLFVASVSGLYAGKAIERLGRVKGLTELEEA